MGPRKAVVGKSNKKQKGVATCSINKFISEKCAENYATMQDRNIIPERKLDVSAQQLEEVAKQIGDRHWETLISYPEVAYAELVKEFYANAYCPVKDDQKAISWIRGTEVPFNSKVIDRLLNLQPIEGSSWTEDDIDYDEMVNLLCIEGTSWNLTKDGEPKNLMYSTFKPIPKVWASFLVFNIIPNSNRSEVKYDRAETTYLIITGRKVNIGTFIESNIQIIANSASNALAYPYLITLLCNDAGVKLDEFIRMKKPSIIDLSYTIKFCGIGGGRSSRTRKTKKDSTPYANQLLLNILQNLHATHTFCGIVNANVMRVEEKLDSLLKNQRVSFPPPRVTFTKEAMTQLVGWTPLTMQPAGPSQNNDEDDEEEEGCEQGKGEEESSNK